jgi:cell division protein FtsN
MSTEILFLLIFFIFAVLQGIGQKRRQAERQGQLPPTGEGEGDAPTGDRERISPRPRERPRVEPSQRTPTRSRETDRPPLRERAPAPAYERPGGTQQPREGATSSEGLVPKDIWEEIMGLARGELETPKPPRQPEPSRTPPPPKEPAWEEVAPRRVATPAPSPRPSAAAPTTKPPAAAAASTPKRPPRRPLSPVFEEGAVSVPRERSRVREELFGDGSPEELRRAIVLREVLGPPLAFRE